MDRGIRNVIENLEVEHKDLTDKIVKLKLSLDNAIIRDVQRYLLNEQLDAMNKYAEVLSVRRLDLLERYS